MTQRPLQRLTNLYSNMANNYYMQKQAAWIKAADSALIKQSAGVVDFIKNNPELVGALLGGTAGAGIGAAASKENRLLGALGGGALGAGVGAGGGYAARWLQNYLANRSTHAGVPVMDLHRPVESSGKPVATLNDPVSVAELPSTDGTVQMAEAPDVDSGFGDAVDPISLSSGFIGAAKDKANASAVQPQTSPSAAKAVLQSARGM